MDVNGRRLGGKRAKSSVNNTILSFSITGGRARKEGSSSSGWRAVVCVCVCERPSGGVVRVANREEAWQRCIAMRQGGIERPQPAYGWRRPRTGRRRRRARAGGRRTMRRQRHRGRSTTKVGRTSRELCPRKSGWNFRMLSIYRCWKGCGGGRTPAAFVGDIIWKHNHAEEEKTWYENKKKRKAKEERGPGGGGRGGSEVRG